MVYPKAMPRIRAASIAEHKVITRTEILDTALELFGVLGYRETSFGEIAAAMGIGRTTLYEYFSDKEDLLASLVEETLPPSIKKIVEQIPEGLPPAERLRRLVVLMVEFVIVEPTLGLMLHLEVPHLSGSAQERVAAAHRSLVREYSEAYRAGVEEGVFLRMPPEVAGTYLNNTIMLAAQTMLNYEDPAEALECTTRTVTDLLFNGLAARADRIEESRKPGLWRSISGLGRR